MDSQFQEFLFIADFLFQLSPGYKEEGDCGQCTNCIVQTQDNQYCFDDYMKIFEVGIQDDDADYSYS